MSPERIDFITTLVGHSDLSSGDLVAELRECLERARVVGVLDAWAAETKSREESGGTRNVGWLIVPRHRQVGPVCTLGWEEWSGEEDGHWCDMTRRFEGETEDAARAAATKAIEAGEV